ncbi:MAG: cation:proton antiporter [Candidatus ainarchaeum sp.]|nr:cation:proton antiporter [Candidatus ainarchaeum sp.]
MDVPSIYEFGWILVFAALAGMICVRLRLPPVVGLLVAGMVMGPILHLVELPTINTLAEIGTVLLLFMIGVEFSVAKLLARGLRAIISSLLLILLSFAIMHEVAILLGFDAISSLFIASMLSMSSTAIMMKILEQKRLLERQEVPVLVTMLIIEDLFAVFMLAFFSNLKSGSFSGEEIFSALLIAVAVLSFGYLALSVALKKFSSVFLRYQSEDTTILFAFSLGIGMSIAASMLGLTPAIGAFLAGSLIAGLPNGRDFEQSMRPFSILFSSFFFLSIGMLIDPAGLLVSAELTLLLICAFILVIFLATTLVFYLISSSGRSSVFAGLAMLPLGEFSLLIAKESMGVVETNLVGIASVGVLVTSILCSLSLNRSERTYLFLKASLPPKLLDTLKDASGYFRNVLSAFEPGGYFHRVLVHELKRTSVALIYILGACLFFWFARLFLQFPVSFDSYTVMADAVLLAALAVLSIFPLLKILSSAKRLFNALATIFSRTTPQAHKAAIIRNLLISAFFFALFADSPFIVALLLLPDAFNWIAVVFAILSLFFFWSAVRASSTWFLLRERKMVNILHEQVVASDDDVILVAEESPRHRKPKPSKKRKVMFLR